MTAPPATTPSPRRRRRSTSPPSTTPPRRPRRPPAPPGTDGSVSILEDHAYALTAADFGFSDATDGDANSLSAVKITTLPVGGTLTDNGGAVSVGQFISLANITGGKLIFTPTANLN